MTTIHNDLPAWPGLQSAMDDVRDHALRTGMEGMIVLNRDGSRKYTFDGDYNQVQVPDDVLASNGLRGTFVVHSHPVPAELSAADILFATAHGAVGIIATMPDGSWSYTKGLKVRMPYDFESALFQQLGVPTHPVFAAMIEGQRAYERAPDHNVGAKAGNRVIIEQLTGQGMLDDYRLNLLPEGLQAFTGLPGIGLK